MNNKQVLINKVIEYFLAEGMERHIIDEFEIWACVVPTDSLNDDKYWNIDGFKFTQPLLDILLKYIITETKGAYLEFIITQAVDGFKYKISYERGSCVTIVKKSIDPDFKILEKVRLKDDTMKFIFNGKEESCSSFEDALNQLEVLLKNTHGGEESHEYRIFDKKMFVINKLDVHEDRDYKYEMFGNHPALRFSCNFIENNPLFLLAFDINNRDMVNLVTPEMINNRAI